MAEAGVIRDADLFHLLLRVTGTDKRLQAGYYRLKPAMSIFEIMEQLQHGRTTATAVTIPEGFELRQIAARLRDQGLVDYNKFMELALDASKVFGDSPPLEIPIASLEGYLFPDTYRISYGQTEAEIIRQMVGRFSEVVLPAVEGMVGRWGLGLHEIITLASIVEREVMVDWERPLVASVFLNRLRINMPLRPINSALRNARGPEQSAVQGSGDRLPITLTRTAACPQAPLPVRPGLHNGGAGACGHRLLLLCGTRRRHPPVQPDIC